MHETKVYYGNMSTEYTLEDFVIQGVKITEGYTRWFEDFNLKDDFLNEYDDKTFTAKEKFLNFRKISYLYKK